MIRENSVHEIVPGRGSAPRTRVGEAASTLFAKHGIKMVGLWTSDAV